MPNENVNNSKATNFIIIQTTIIVRILSAFIVIKNIKYLHAKYNNILNVLIDPKSLISND